MNTFHLTVQLHAAHTCILKSKSSPNLDIKLVNVPLNKATIQQSFPEHFTPFFSTRGVTPVSLKIFSSHLGLASMTALESTAGFLQIGFCTSESVGHCQNANKPWDRGTTAHSISPKCQLLAFVFKAVTLYLSFY